MGASPSESTANALINAVIAAEKLTFADSVRFLGGSAYHIGFMDTPGDTDAIETVELSPTGNQGAVTSAQTGGAKINPEMAHDLKFLLGGRRYLRSMLHTSCALGMDDKSVTPTTSSNITAALKTFAEKMLNGPWPESYQRIAPNGDRPSAIQYNTFLEHRQFHRYRRRNAGELG